MITIVAIFILLIIGIYFYASDTTKHFVHSINAFLKMFLIGLILLIILIIAVYTLIKYKTII